MLRNDVKLPRISRARQRVHEKDKVFNNNDVSAGKDPSDLSEGESVTATDRTLVGSDSDVIEANERSESKFAHRVHVIDGLSRNDSAVN